MKGAKGVLINITGGLDMTLHEVDEAANRIREEVDADANIIFGSTFDATMQGRMRVSVVATGIAAIAAQQPAPNYLSLDMNRPMQTGQPALSRPVAPVGRVAMPAAATAMPAAPMAAMPIAPPPAPPIIAPPASMPAVAAAPPIAAPMAAPIAPAPIVEAPIPAQIMATAPVEAPAAPAPAPAPMAPPVAAAAPIAAPPAAPAAPRPLVDENDWRVSRPTAKAPARTSESLARPVAARAASESRSPNLFQRITGAFAAPKPAAPIAPPVTEAAARAAENVVAVQPKPAAKPAPVQTSISLDVTERTRPARDDDDLQIPAFLRRQAN
jgi:cell division protein FtsZ